MLSKYWVGTLERLDLASWSSTCLDVLESLKLTKCCRTAGQRKLWQEAVGLWQPMSTTWGKHVKNSQSDVPEFHAFSLLQDGEHVLQTWETKDFPRPSWAQLGTLNGNL